MRRVARHMLLAGLAVIAFAGAPAWTGGGEAAASESASGEADRSAEHGELAGGLEPNRGARYDARQEPAEGGAYQYRQIGLALVIIAFTIAFLGWLVRRPGRDRRSYWA